MKPLLIYCYDAYCGWCYGFSPVISKVSREYSEKLSFEVFSGGMILTPQPVHISKTAGYIQKAYKTVEERTGVRFGQDYLWHIFNPDKSDWYPGSEKPAIALCIFKEYMPDAQIELAAELQYGLHFEGRDLTDDEAYRHLLDRHNLPVDEFYDKLHQEEYREKAYYEFALVKQLQVNGFPSVFLQVDESKFYLVARGYTEYDRLTKSIGDVLYSITNRSSS